MTKQICNPQWNNCNCCATPAKLTDCVCSRSRQDEWKSYDIYKTSASDCSSKCHCCGKELCEKRGLLHKLCLVPGCKASTMRYILFNKDICKKSLKKKKRHAYLSRPESGYNTGGLNIPFTRDPYLEHKGRKRCASVSWQLGSLTPFRSFEDNDGEDGDVADADNYYMKMLMLLFNEENMPIVDKNQSKNFFKDINAFYTKNCSEIPKKLSRERQSGPEWLRQLQSDLKLSTVPMSILRKSISILANDPRAPVTRGFDLGSSSDVRKSDFNSFNLWSSHFRSSNPHMRWTFNLKEAESYYSNEWEQIAERRKRVLEKTTAHGYIRSSVALRHLTELPKGFSQESIGANRPSLRHRLPDKRMRKQVKQDLKRLLNLVETEHDFLRQLGYNFRPVLFHEPYERRKKWTWAYFNPIEGSAGLVHKLKTLGYQPDFNATSLNLIDQIMGSAGKRRHYFTPDQLEALLAQLRPLIKKEKIYKKVREYDQRLS